MALPKAGSNWVEGDRFFDRDAELEQLRRRVADGTHTLITAQRRMGKTSLLREFLRRLREEGLFEAVFADLESAQTSADVVAELGTASRHIQSLSSRLKAMGAKATGRIESLEAFELKVQLRANVDGGTWRQQDEALFAAMERSRKPVVLAVDELPIFLTTVLGDSAEQRGEGTRDAADFMNWLRTMAQRYRRVTLILAGSIGLMPVLRRLGLSAQANVYAPLELKAWDEEMAVACLGELASTAGIDFPAELRQQVCTRLRCCVPHHVQQFFAHLDERLVRNRRGKAERSDIEAVYDEMLGVRGQIDLAHYEDRLRMALGEDDYLTALQLLTEATVAGGTLATTTLSRYRDAGLSGSVDSVLYVLEHDGYLMPDPQGYRFVSGLFEDWWRARHGAHFVPIEQRGG